MKVRIDLFAELLKGHIPVAFDQGVEFFYAHFLLLLLKFVLCGHLTLRTEPEIINYILIFFRRTEQAEPVGEDTFIRTAGWIVSVIIASAALFCGLGLGYSVSLRKQGRSKISFAVQFAGVVGIGLTVLLYGVFVGNLISPLN